MTAALESTFRVTLSIDGEDWGVWDKKSGGKLGTNASSYPPGGMGDVVALSGTPSLDVISLSRLYVYERDHDNLPALKAKRGKGRCVVKQTPLDGDGHAYGNPETRSGLLISVQTPSVDNLSSSPAMIEIEIQPGVTV